MLMREGSPQPISTKQPKLSRCVTRAGMISPGVRWSMYSERQRSWAARRDKMGRGAPASSCSIAVMRKQTDLFTREMMAISRTVCSFIPRAPSSRGMIPRQQPISTTRLWS